MLPSSLDKPHRNEPSIDPWDRTGLTAAATERPFRARRSARTPCVNPRVDGPRARDSGYPGARPGDRRRWRGLGRGGVPRRHRRRLQDAKKFDCAPQVLRSPLDGAGRGLGRQSAFQGTSGWLNQAVHSGRPADLSGRRQSGGAAPSRPSRRLLHRRHGASGRCFPASSADPEQAR